MKENFVFFFIYSLPFFFRFIHAKNIHDWGSFTEINNFQDTGSGAKMD